MRKYLNLVLPVSVFFPMVISGWGLGGWQEYFANPARTGVVALVLMAAIAIFILGLDLDPLRPGQSKLGHQSGVLLLLTVASLGLLWFLPYGDRRRILIFHDAEVWRWIGLLLCVLGVATRLLALQKLGKQFSAYVTLQEGHELVQSGIYGVIRHPLYLSLLLAGPGFALVFRSLLVWPILALTLAFITSRIRQEERLLAAEFGTAFDQYRNATWTLMPFVF